ncbi:MAG: META domain-containing protein [Desulfobulbaceae bacterium]|nr:META domain-containing protein [Desulfobulbaceae bacterium]
MAAATETESPALSSALFGPNAGKYGPEILPGTTWAWDSSQYNDTEARPEDSSRYTISFKADGVIGIRADCNIAQGSYTTRGKSLLIQLGPGTMAACGPKSLEQRFLRDLEGSAVWFLKQSDLYLDLKADTGTMKFYRLLE